MKDERMTVSFGNAFEISAETESALSKLPSKAQEIAREITRKQVDARNDANEKLAGIQSSADELTKETAKRVLELVQSYNMDKDENAPFKNWGEFAKAAWNKSASWVTQNKRVASEILNSKDKTAQTLSTNFNFSQLAELLPLTKDGISPHIADGLKSGTLRPNMKASDVRDWTKQFLSDGVTKVRLSDVYFVESGKRLDAVNLDNYIVEDENTAVLSFNPKTVDADTDTAWKGKVCVDLQTMKAAVVLYHAHKNAPKTDSNIKHLDATDRLALSIREMPPKLWETIVAEYMDDESVDFDKLCLLVGVDRNQYEF